MHKDIQHVEAKYWTSVILLGYQVLVEGLERNYLWLNDTMDIKTVMVMVCSPNSNWSINDKSKFT